LSRPGGAAAYGLAGLRLATGGAFACAGVQAAHAFAADSRLGTPAWSPLAAVAVGLLVTLGMAVVLGIGLRISAAAGTSLVATFTMYAWATGWDSPFGGVALVYPLVLLVLATTHAGDIWGAGRAWAAQPFVRGRRWLR
jgi:thiosulfate dehydrogenase [quinone] large subunit